MDNRNCKLPAVSVPWTGLSLCDAGGLGLVSAATAVGEVVYRRAGPGVCSGALAAVWSWVALCDWRRRGGDPVGIAQLPHCPSARGFSSGTISHVQMLTPPDAQMPLVTSLEVSEENGFWVVVQRELGLLALGQMVL